MSVTKIPVDGLSGGEGILSAAYTGVLETNATFVDQAIFGPSVDGKSWNGKWTANDSSGDLLFTSLMLVTIETDDTNTEVNIWDLTEQSVGAISTSVIKAIPLSGKATPTSVAACMGYIIVGSEDGTSIIDPHSGSWAERTAGYPKNLTTGTVPALQSNTIDAVGAGFARQPDFDPRTGGPLPTFVAGYTSGSYACEVIKTDGTSYRSSWAAGEGPGVGIYNGRVVAVGAANGRVRVSDSPIENITADGFTGGYISSDTSTTFPQSHGANTAMSNIVGNHLALADTTGLTMVRAGAYIGGKFDTTTNALINGTYNTGYLIGDTRGAWLANSATTDRSSRANDLSENGAVTEASVNGSAELKAYSGFSDSTNYLSLAYDSDLDFGTGDMSLMLWFNRSNTSGTQNIVNRASSGAGGSNILVQGFDGAHTIRVLVGDGSNSVDLSGQPYPGSVWNQLVASWDGTTKTLKMYLNGSLRISGTNASTGSLNNSNAALGVGSSDTGANAYDGGSLALFRMSATALSDTQVRQIYDAEKPMFAADAECLLQGASDAVEDVDVDPLTNKVLVTQADAITVFDGLAVDKLFADAGKPTKNAGDAEKGKLWGNLRAEQNTVNAYVTAPAVDQRQVNEMVRGMASELPAGIDLSKAKAWAHYDSASVAIYASYNVKSITDRGTGAHTINFAVPFKSGKYACLGACRFAYGDDGVTFSNTAHTGGSAYVYVTRGSTGGYVDPGDVYVVFFGELENE